IAYGKSKRMSTISIAKARITTLEVRKRPVISVLRLFDNIVFIDEKACVGRWVFGHDAGAADHRREWVSSDFDRDAKHLGEQLGQAAKQGAAAKDGDSAFKNIREKLGRRAFDDVLHCVHEGIK